jgi:DNA-binding transcriptional LysR family regulator
MISPIDMALLPALDALLTESNVTRAAARLGISQPALSAKLARLRDLTGDRLLVPSGKGRGMVLTPRAVALRTRIREALAVAEAALGDHAGFDPSTSRATVRIIANDNAASLTLAVLLAGIAGSKASGVRVALLRPDGRRLADRLEQGEADLAVSAEEAPAGSDALYRHVILTDRYATAQRRDHPRGAGALDLDAFCAADHLIVSDGAAFDGMIDDALRALGRSRRVTLSVHSYLLAPMIAARSDLLVTLPRQLLEQNGDGLELFEPPLPLPAVVLSAFWHQRTDGDPVNRWLRECLFAPGVARPSAPKTGSFTDN